MIRLYNIPLQNTNVFLPSELPKDIWVQRLGTLMCLDSLLAFISAGIPLLVLMPVSLIAARSKWDAHNAVIGEQHLSSDSHVC